MTLTMIAAIGQNNELGKDNTLIWHFPQDLKFFRNQTKGHTIIMGRKTFESLPGMLPKRHHIVISRSNPDLPEAVEVFSSIEAFLEKYKDVDEEIFVIGGAQIYSQMLKYANRLLLTEIEQSYDADAFFPAFDSSQYDKKILSDITENGVHYNHIEYTRKNNMNYQELLEQVKVIAKEAAEFMANGTVEQVDEKGDVANIVTNMDVATQNLVIEKLTPLIPDAIFFAEEKENQALTNEYTWIIDPIDGTSNYAYDFKHSCVSIALAYNHEPLLGAVYDPYLKELFWALKGEGAYVNGQKLQVKQNPMRSSLILIGTSPYKKDLADKTFDTLKRLFVNGRDLRRSGSAVLDLAYVAAGRVDAFYEESLSFWDYAAASLFVMEAGGCFAAENGNWGDVAPVRVLAGNPNNIDDLKELVK